MSPEIALAFQRLETLSPWHSFMKNRILILGDLLAIALITILGFASHGEAGVSFLPRMAAMFFPLSITWFVLAPSLGLFRQEMISAPNQLWRAALAALFAAPLAAVLRGFFLNAPVIPIFAAVLSGTSALGMVIWRGIYLYWSRRAKK